MNKTGCQWAYLPHDFPPPTTVNYHYMKWMAAGFFERVNAEIRREVRNKRVLRKDRQEGSGESGIIFWLAQRVVKAQREIDHLSRF